MPKTIKEIELNTALSIIRNEITVGRRLSLTEFAEEYGKELKIKPASLKNYLSGTTISFPAIRKLYTFLGLGNLTKEIKFVVTYKVEKP